MNLPPLEPAAYRDLVRRALEEDLKDVLGRNSGDITTDATISLAQWARGDFRAKADCVVAGLEVAFECFRALQPDVRPVGLANDGVKVTSGTLIASVADMRARCSSASGRRQLSAADVGSPPDFRYVRPQAGRS
jgi:nicotinate-nucleotide pyrophosphorylase (carboxylating)